MATDSQLEQVPAELRIGSYRWAVSSDAENSYDYDYFGVTLVRSKRIKISPQQSDTDLRQTVLHEALHALGVAYEIKEWTRHTVDEDDKVTDKIELMAMSLIQFMRENPNVIKWLQEQV